MKLICIWLAVCGSFLYASNSKAQLTYDELEVQYDSPWVYKNLQLIPIKFKEKQNKIQPSTAIISLQEAIRQRLVSIKEMQSEAGSDVNVLMIKNHSKKNILIHSGEMLKGGKQDRAIAATTIIPPGGEENYIPVFCIEKGRWDDKTKPFQYAGTADISLRRKIDKNPKQHEIWKEIDRQFGTKKIDSETWPYLQLRKNFSSNDTAAINFFRRKMEASDSAFAGFIASSGNSIINCELFGSEGICLLSYLPMIESYLTSISKEADASKITDDEIQLFLDKFLKNNQQQQNYLNQQGKIYKYQNKIIHLVAYDE